MAHKINAVSHAVVVQASKINDLEGAVTHVQKEAGISSGDAASMFFSEAVKEPTKWSTYSSVQRVGLLKKYLSFELNLVKLLVSPALTPADAEEKHIRLFQVRYCGNIRHDEDGEFDVVFHDDSPFSGQRHSPETFSSYEEAVREADRLDEEGARPHDWPLANAL